jgi:Tol biopolymer transport system component
VAKGEGMKSALLVAALVTAAAQGKYGTTNVPVPVIFAPGIISGPSNDGSPTFSPDGKTLLFERSYAAFTVIFEARRIRGGHWSRPAPAIFSGPTADQQPSFSPDGSYLIYASIRLISGGDGKSTQSHLYRVDRTTDGWGTPKELPATVNFARRMFKPSVARNGDLYVMADDGLPGTPPKWRLYHVPKAANGYGKAEILPFTGGPTGDVDPCIAPDQSYLIFSSRDRAKTTPNGPSDDGHEHLYFVRRRGSGWGPVEALRYDGDNWGADDGEAQLAPDGKTLYFTSGRSEPVNRTWTRARMLARLADMEKWDNSNSNVWALPLEHYFPR